MVWAAQGKDQEKADRFLGHFVKIIDGLFEIWWCLPLFIDQIDVKWLVAIIYVLENQTVYRSSTVLFG